MGVLRLAVLGPPLVEHQGRTLVLPTRKTLALLIYLAMTGGMQSRAGLARLFWPDSKPAQRLTTLRSKLHALRQAIGDVSASGSHTPAHQHLIVQRESIRLAQEDLVLDTKQLQSAFISGSKLNSSPPRADNLTWLEDATQLIRGPFLEGLVLDELPAFEEWLISQRVYWQQQVDSLFEQCSRLALDQYGGAYTKPIVQRWLTYDPTNEAAHRWMMEALLVQGKPAECLTLFSSYRRLMQQLGFPPLTPEIEALAARARQIRVASPLSIPVAMTLAGQAQLTTPFELPLVGRSQEMGQLISAVYQASRDGIQLALVRGEAGIGKTHLVTALTDWARKEGWEVLWGRGFETGGRLPYGPLLEALRPRLEQERAPDDLLEDVWLSELSRLFPELRDRYPDLPSPLPEGSEGPVRLFEAVSLLIMAWAKRTPLLLVIDDIQWIDRATQDLLIYLLHSWKRQQIPILIVLVGRLEATDMPSPLTMLLSELGRTIPVRHLQLDPLREQDMQTLVSQLALPLQGTARTELPLDMVSVSQWLFQETEGHPLFLVHTLRELLERKLLSYRSTVQSGWALDFSLVAASLEQLQDWVPTNVQEVIENRLARLSPPAQSLLLATAVLGQEATFEQICLVGDLPETIGLQALEEMLALRFLREHYQSQYASSPSYAFSHDKIRAVVVMRSSQARLRFFHRRALKVLEQQPIPAMTLAFHATEAGITDATFRYSVQAGDEAMALFAVQDALLSYTRALAILQRDQQSQHDSDVFSTDALEHLYTHLGRAYELVGQWEQARITYENMLALARTRRTWSLASVALTSLALLVAQYEFDAEKARHLLSEAQVLADRTNEARLMGESAWNLGQMAIHVWQTTEALQKGERALQLAKAHGLRELTARSLYLLGLITTYQGDFEQAASYLCAALAQYDQMDQTDTQRGVLTPYILLNGPSASYQWTNQDAIIGCLCVLTVAQVCLGELQPAHETIERALSLSQGRHNIWVVAWTRYNRNHVLLEQGEYEQALQSIKEALEAMSLVPNNVPRFYSLVIYGFTLQELGVLQEALTIMEEALAFIQTVPIPAYQVLLVPWMCVNRGLAGDWQRATHYALQARELREQTDARLIMMGFTGPYETKALLHGGYVRWARTDVERFARRIGTNRRFRICCLRSTAVLAQYDSNLEEAISSLQEAATLAEEIGIPREYWQIQTHLAELYNCLSQPHQAKEAFYQARRTLQDLSNRIQDEKLLQKFLEAPHVRHVLQASESESGSI